MKAPTPNQSSSRSSREPTPTPKSQTPSRTPTPVPKKRKNSIFQDSRIFFSECSVLTLIMVFFVLAALFYYIFITIQNILHCSIQNPPETFCGEENTTNGFCLECPEHTKCVPGTGIFTCDDGYVRFGKICHVPGRVIKSEDFESLWKYKEKIFNSKNWNVTSILQDPENKFDRNDLEIIMNFDGNSYIYDNQLVFHSKDDELCIFYDFSAALFATIFVSLVILVLYLVRSSSPVEKRRKAI